MTDIGGKMTKRKKSTALGTIGAWATALALTVAACGSGSEDGSAPTTQVSTSSAATAGGGEPEAPTGDPILIGEVVPLSGFIAEYGNHQTSGVNLAVEQINAAGGLLVNGVRHPVQLRSYDDKCEPTEAVTATTRLLDEGAIAIIGSVCSSNTLAMRPITERARRVLVTPASTAPSITGPDHPYMFRTLGHIGLMAQSLIPYGVQELGLKKFGFIAVNNDFGRSAVEFYGDKMRELGAEVIDAQFYEAGTVDYFTTLSKIDSEGPDGLFLAGGAAEGGAIIRQMQERGMLDRITILQHGLSTKEFAELAGQDRVEGCCIGAVGFAFDELTDESKAFVLANEAIFGSPANEVVVYAYDAAMALMRAIEKAGTIEDNEAIRQAMADLTLEDYRPLNAIQTHEGGRIFDSVGQLHPSYILASWQGGNFLPVPKR